MQYLPGGGGGLGNQRGRHRGKSLTQRERGVDVTFNTYGGGGALLFTLFSQTRKVVEELCSYFLRLELYWENINSRCFDL